MPEYSFTQTRHWCADVNIDNALLGVRIELPSTTAVIYQRALDAADFRAYPFDLFYLLEMTFAIINVVDDRCLCMISYWLVDNLPTIQQHPFDLQTYYNRLSPEHIRTDIYFRQESIEWMLIFTIEFKVARGNVIVEKPSGDRLIELQADGQVISGVGLMSIAQTLTLMYGT